jgi:1-acyl-sn-glycerol-3-phosphate acyltransferase
MIFVERNDLNQTLVDTQLLVERARRGETIFSFPEGTFTRNPGLRPFHLGAFSMAVETGLPVVPIALSGTRSILHPDS